MADDTDDRGEVTVTPAAQRALRAIGERVRRDLLRGPISAAQMPGLLEPLLDRHGIDKSDPERWLLLAWALARKHEPSCRPGRGRSSTVWSSENRMRLWQEVTAALKGGRTNVQSVCYRLAASEPWVSLVKSATVEQRAERLREQFEASDSPITIWVDGEGNQEIDAGKPGRRRSE